MRACRYDRSSPVPLHVAENNSLLPTPPGTGIERSLLVIEAFGDKIVTAILIGHLGKNAEVKTAQNKKDYAVLSIATSESWKNDKGEYETRTEWHRVYAWGNLSNFAKTLQKGQLVSLEGKIKYRAIEETVKGQQVKYTIAEIHASSIRRLSKIEAADDPSDGADEA